MADQDNITEQPLSDSTPSEQPLGASSSGQPQAQAANQQTQPQPTGQQQNVWQQPQPTGPAASPYAQAVQVGETPASQPSAYSPYAQQPVQQSQDQQQATQQFPNQQQGVQQFANQQPSQQHPSQQQPAQQFPAQQPPAQQFQSQQPPMQQYPGQQQPAQQPPAQQFASQQPPAQQPPTPPKDNKRTLTIVLGVIGIVCLVAAIGVLIFALVINPASKAASNSSKSSIPKTTLAEELPGRMIADDAVCTIKITKLEFDDEGNLNLYFDVTNHAALELTLYTSNGDAWEVNNEPVDVICYTWVKSGATKKDECLTVPASYLSFNDVDKVESITGTLIADCSTSVDLPYEVDLY